MRTATKAAVLGHCPKCSRMVGLRSNGQLSPHKDHVWMWCAGRLNHLIPRARQLVEKNEAPK